MSTSSYRYLTLHNAVHCRYRYWPLFDKLSPEAAKNVSYQNAYNHYFKDWDIPSGEGGERRYSRMDSYYQTEMLDPKQGTFVTGKATDLDDDGLY